MAYLADNDGEKRSIIILVWTDRTVLQLQKDMIGGMHLLLESDEDRRGRFYLNSADRTALLLLQPLADARLAKDVIALESDSFLRGVVADRTIIR